MLLGERQVTDMSDEAKHECGVAALYWLQQSVGKQGPAIRPATGGDTAAFMAAMLLDLQNRGQLAAGFSSYNPQRAQLIDTYKDVGTVGEVFRMSHPAKRQAIFSEYAGRAVIGHTRYATCGADDARHAQPFERHHGRLWKWFSFAFNGTLSNYTNLRDEILARQHYHFSLDTDTEIIMHMLAYHLRGDRPPPPERLMRALSRRFDGAYNIAFLDAMGRMFVARDPLGIRPMSWAVQGKLFGAASESVALANLGFTDIHSLKPAQMAIIEDGALRIASFAKVRRRARCFFEWVYFANVAGVIDGVSVYESRAAAGARLAVNEDQPAAEDSIVVPVPDTAKAAADAFAHRMGIPCVEGLIRNRYVGRTFIQPSAARDDSVSCKYTPLPSVLKGKRVFLLEDSIVRSTTLRMIARLIRERGHAREVHVRVACPPIIAPCFYGIDMSTLGELFAPKMVRSRYDGRPRADTLRKMAGNLGVDSLRYLAVQEIASCIGCADETLCLGCVTGKYPTPWGDKLLRRAKQRERRGKSGRSYETKQSAKAKRRKR